MDDETLIALVEAIPPGHWMSYGDLCAEAGGHPRQALGLNGRLTRLAPHGAHRVLKEDGTVAPTALGDPRRVHNTLAKEKLGFTRGRADPGARIVGPLAARVREEAARARAEAAHEREAARHEADAAGPVPVAPADLSVDHGAAAA